MDWMNRSFEDHTVVWLLISTVLGGAVGSAITFVHQDVLRPWLGFRRDTARLVRTYTTPLLRSTEALERRIENFVTNPGSTWYTDDEYYRLSTLFVFADYLGLVRTLERQFGFVPIESERRGRQLQRRLNGFFRALTSWAYFDDPADPTAVEASALPRFMLRAIGEAVTDPAEPRRTMEFTDFARRYETDPQFRRWFAELDAFLRAAGSGLRRTRLIAGQANLRALMMFLDPDGTMVTPHRWPRLLDRLDDNDPVRPQLETEFADVAARAEAHARRHRKSER